MRFVYINPSPNRKHRRTLNAIALRDPSPENIKANNVLTKLPVNKPYRNAKRVLKPRGKSERRIYRAAVRQAREAA